MCTHHFSQALISPNTEQDFVHAFDDDQDDVSVVSRLSLQTIQNNTHNHAHNESADAFTNDHGFLPVHLPKKFAHARTHHTPAKSKPLPLGVARAIESSNHTKNTNMSPGRSGASSLAASGTPSRFDILFEYISAHIMVHSI